MHEVSLTLTNEVIVEKILEIGSKVKTIAKGYEKVEAEKKLEEDMVRRGVHRFHKNIKKSKAKMDKLRIFP